MREIEERLQAYLQAGRLPPDAGRFRGETFPLPDEEFAATWEQYMLEAGEGGYIFPVLRRHLPQLQFPVQAGMRSDEAYLRATRRGIPPAASAEDSTAGGLQLQKTRCLRLEVYPTLAGRLPLLSTDCRPDFELLIQALSAGNEPVFIPTAQGAALIKGYNNWDRAAEVRRREVIAAVIPSLAPAPCVYPSCPRKYQDCLALVCEGGYSGVAAGSLGLKEGEWQQLSRLIRREHEAAHYAILRLLGMMRTHLLDELLADFMGIVAARGVYDPYWQLLFLGLENYPRYRPGGRLENYVQDAGLLQGEALTLLGEIVVRAVAKLDKFARSSQADARRLSGKAELLTQLLALTAGDWL
jgi:hypothetical protein